MIMSRLEAMPSMPVPFWDDVSAIDIGQGRAVVLKTDMLVWSTDVPQGMSHYQAAKKAVVMNISDLGAKGVAPTAVLVSLGLPRDLTSDLVEEMARGMNDGAREYGAYVVGGDTNETDDIIVSGMAYGLASIRRIMKRSGSQPGDLLATTGLFGNTGAAYQILLRGLEAPKKLRSSLVESVYTPKARVKEGLALAKRGAATSSMDSSDGLAMSLHDLSRSSGNGFRIEKLPLSSQAMEFAELHELDASDLVLYGGEEYELVFTVKPAYVTRAREALKAVGGELILIGSVTSEREVVLDVDGEVTRIEPVGWDHFTSKRS